MITPKIIIKSIATKDNYFDFSSKSSVLLFSVLFVSSDYYYYITISFETTTFAYLI